MSDIIISRDGSTMIGAKDIYATSINFPIFVPCIGEKAFEGMPNLSKVYITDDVREISRAAFRNCKSLREVEIYGKIRSIGDEAFADCPKLKKVILHESNKLVYVSENAFRGTPFFEKAEPFIFGHVLLKCNADCPDLSDITQIGSRAFKDNKTLTSITIPATVQEIGSNAFEGCTNLKSVIFSGRVDLGDEVFKGCSSLVKVKTSNSVHLGDRVFKDCINLETLYLPKGIADKSPDTICENCVALKNCVIGNMILLKTDEKDFYITPDISKYQSKKFNIFGYTIDTSNWNYIMFRTLPRIAEMIQMHQYHAKISITAKAPFIARAMQAGDEAAAEYIRSHIISITKGLIDIDDRESLSIVLEDAKRISKDNIFDMCQCVYEYSDDWDLREMFDNAYRKRSGIRLLENW